MVSASARFLLSCLIVLLSAGEAFKQPIRRVPAEFEPQEAIWLQWPGRFEKTYEPAYAQISNGSRTGSSTLGGALSGTSPTPTTTPCPSQWVACSECPWIS